MFKKTINLTLLCSVAVMMNLTLTGCSDAQDPQVNPPNILFFLADDLGMMDLGTYNPDTFYETPNVERLANSGMKFTHAYGTNPVCSPSRFSIVTGIPPGTTPPTGFAGTGPTVFFLQR